MFPNALLFIVLAVLWAAVLIPMWLRGHDRATENRSVDRFSRALSSLGRRSGSPDTQETVVVPRGGSRPAREVLMPSRPQGASTPRVTVAGAAATRGAPAGAAVRRRRLVLALLVVAAGLLTGGLLHRIPVWLTAIPLVLVAAVLISARRSAARRAEMTRRKAHREVLSEAARAAQAARESRPVARPGERAIDEALPHAEPLAEPTADGRWEAVPTTLPTYVTAPAATAVPRVIDRRTPGGLSGAAMVEQARRTRQVQAEDSGMRVESFEIAIPTRPTPKQEFAERYVDQTAGAAELDAVDDEAAIEALLADPRSGYVAPRRRAAG